MLIKVSLFAAPRVCWPGPGALPGSARRGCHGAPLRGTVRGCHWGGSEGEDVSGSEPGAEKNQRGIKVAGAPGGGEKIWRLWPPSPALCLTMGRDQQLMCGY